MNKYLIRLKKARSTTENIYSQRAFHQIIKTQPDQQPISQRSVQLYKHINQLNPYSVHHPQNNLDGKIENICKLHLSIKRTSPPPISNSYYQQNGTIQTQFIKKISEVDYKHRSKNLKQRFITELKKIQKNVEGREQEKQIAETMIKGIKQDRKKSNALRTKFNKKIKDLEDSIAKQNDKLKHIFFRLKRGDKKIEKDFQREELNRQMDAHNTRYSYWLNQVNKNDYYQFAKPNSNKVINLSQITHTQHIQGQTRSNEKKSFNFVSNYLVEKKKMKFNAKRLSF